MNRDNAIEETEKKELRKMSNDSKKFGTLLITLT